LITWDLVGDPAAASAFPQFRVVPKHSSLPESKNTRSGVVLESKPNKEHSMALTLDQLRKEHPELVKQLLESSTSDIVKLESTIRKQLEEEYEANYKQLLPETLEKLRAQVISENRNRAVPLVEARDQEIAALKKQLEEEKTSSAKVKAQLEESMKIANAALLSLHLEKSIGDFGKGAHPCAVQIRKMVGTIQENMTLESLDLRIAGVATQLFEERDAQNKQKSEVAALQKQLAEAKEANKRAQQETFRAAMLGYVASKVKGHPNAKALSESIIRSKPRSKRDVDESYEKYASNYKPSRTLTEVRNGVGGNTKRRSLPLRSSIDESAPSPKSQSTRIQGSLFGVQLEEIQDRAGAVALHG
jgi:hypothetical protein